MPKYYKVYLTETISSNPENYVICRKSPFSHKTFKEIITNKKIVPKIYTIGNIRYDFYVPIHDNRELESWLNNIGEEELEKHIKDMETLEENEMLYYIELDEKIDLYLKEQEKTNIKKKLKKIRMK